MTGTLCQSAALGRSIAPWVAMIAALFGIMIETILSAVEKVGNISHAPGFRCRKGGAAPARITPTAGVDPDIIPSAPGYRGKVMGFERPKANRKGTAGKVSRERQTKKESEHRFSRT